MIEHKKDRQPRRILKWLARMSFTGVMVVSQAAFSDISAVQAEAGGDGNDTVVITVDEGAAAVTVNNVNKTVCAAKVNAVAAVNALLTEEEMKRVSEGEFVEIRVDVEGTNNVTEEDRKAILQGMETYRDKILGLTLGMYVDVSIFKRMGEEEWSVVNEIRKPMEIVFDVPEELRGLSTDFYIIRAYEGESLLLKDMDDDPESITVQSECFSAYAITYKMKKTGSGAGKCGLCNACPTFFGICCFIWLAALVTVLVVLLFLMCSVERREAEEMEEEEEEPYSCYNEWD